MRTYLYFTILALCFIATLVIRLMNPDMTETRLFIEFWEIWIGMIAIMGLGYFIQRGGL